MNFNTYVQEAQKTFLTDSYRTQEERINYLKDGLISEIGELFDVFKKVARNDGGTITDSSYAHIIEEAGDVMWYWTVLLSELEIDHEHVLWQNIDKLQWRVRAGKIKEHD